MVADIPNLGFPRDRKRLTQLQPETGNEEVAKVRQHIGQLLHEMENSDQCGLK